MLAFSLRRCRLKRAAALLTLAVAAAACAARPGQPSTDVPWRPGFAERFRAGAPEEGSIRTEAGTLPVTLLLPEGAVPFPVVIMLHGCDGLRPRTWERWIRPWAEALHAHGIGVAVVDSFAPRGVEQVCTHGVAAWARRRADDAHAVRAWLAARPFVRGDRIAVLGMSNGGRTVLAALRQPQPEGRTFRAGVALYPGCQSDTEARFAAPLLVLIGDADSTTPARYCVAMRDAQPPGAPSLEVVTYPGALHSFDVDLPPRRYLGMLLGGDARAAADARQRALAFLIAQGVGQ